MAACGGGSSSSSSGGSAVAAAQWQRQRSAIRIASIFGEKRPNGTTRINFQIGDGAQNRFGVHSNLGTIIMNTLKGTFMNL
jgi:hypothetical protein